MKEDRIITNLLLQLNKGKHQAHSASVDNHSNANSNQLEANMSSLDLVEDPTWYLDSVASSHLTRDKSQLTDIVPHSLSSLTTIGGHQLLVHGKGKATIRGNKTLNNILYVPSATRSLIFVGKLADDGHIITFDAKTCSIVHS